ncbi:MAG: hypothetical protein J0M02_08545 [Planctomycetes bacterium]|nr:hypothetical protein [Planctomycetota bacterium]
MTDSGEKFMDILGASDAAAERPAVEWRRRLHRFCENWIFALIIAFGIRHFGVELFRIPSASMEPMLLGDPGLGKGDFVIVDKLTSRFREVQRWDVAVFQYPVPEIESGKGGRARPAIGADGDRLDDPLTRPLLGGNFVKRAVVLPGEEFYIQGGDVFLRDGAGWTVARKPAGLQEKLWQAIYRVDGQPGYRPWAAEGGSSVEVVGDRLDLRLAGGPVRFTQPLRNVYLKDGAVAARPLGGADAWTRVDGIGLTHPRFAWSGGGEGSIWELDRWELKRLTSADNDDPNRGTQINQLMTEWNGDLRVGFDLAALEGSAVLSLVSQAPGTPGPERTIDLTLRPDGWSLAGTGAAAGLLASGPATPVGHRIDLAHVDGQVVVRIDGAEAHRSPVAWVNPNLHRPGLRWSGSGSVGLRGVLVERDLHYTTKGFLSPAPGAADPDTLLSRLGEQGLDPEDRDNVFAGQVRMPRSVRGQLLGKPADELSRSEATRAYGTGPDNPTRAPDGAYLMLGDNSPHSLDGRDWGFVPAENLRGRGWLVVFPPQRWKVIR